MKQTVVVLELRSIASLNSKSEAKNKFILEAGAYLYECAAWIVGLESTDFRLDARV